MQRGNAASVLGLMGGPRFWGGGGGSGLDLFYIIVHVHVCMHVYLEVVICYNNN